MTMELEIKRPDHIVPSYSLTGDLLSYLRCRLQYRYHNGSALPPSRPVQLWFGEFLHGTLEMCYRFWDEFGRNGQQPPDFPWPCTQRVWGQDPPNWERNDIGRFAHLVESALRQQGKQARSTDARDSAYRRVGLAVNELGPHLFPLIASAERKVIGTRPVPGRQVELRCSNYEVHGVIDVLTHITLTRAIGNNLIRRCVLQACPNLQGTFEVVVDYKGARRPLTDEAYWEQGDWQVQTYAWLRQRQPDALPVAAGILIYINELTPGGEEMRAIRRGLANGSADVLPQARSQDEQVIRMWREGMDASQLSLEYRVRRAIRVIPISQQSIDLALASFDDVVRRAEEDIVSETTRGNILHAWAPDCQDEATCAACDFRHFCPNPAPRNGFHQVVAPKAP
jgi:hypothetical protein